MADMYHGRLMDLDPDCPVAVRGKKTHIPGCRSPTLDQLKQNGQGGAWAPCIESGGANAQTHGSDRLPKESSEKQPKSLCPESCHSKDSRPYASGNREALGSRASLKEHSLF